jgi:hypothetical protein
MLPFLTKKLFCKAKKALAFNWDRCDHLVLCLQLILFHWQCHLKHSFKIQRNKSLLFFKLLTKNVLINVFEGCKNVFLGCQTSASCPISQLPTGYFSFWIKLLWKRSLILQNLERQKHLSIRPDNFIFQMTYLKFMKPPSVSSHTRGWRVCFYRP